MIQHVHPSVFDQMQSGKLHDLANLRFVFTMVALAITFLAHGLGIMRTLQSHRQTISEKL